MDSFLNSRGQIITFYSYKGGVGRSMAVANVACLISAKIEKSRKPVLVMDWDLEAPGLHRYFSARCDLPEYRQQPGIIDYFYLLQKLVQQSPEFYKELQTEEGHRILDERLPLHPYLTPDVVPGVDLMRAGRFDDTYARKVGSFGWIDFYEQYSDAIRAFRELLADKYSFVLIDSRTGVTDVSAICTALLPEKLVGVFVPNRQNIDGISEIFRKSLSYRGTSDDFRPLSIFPLPSRIENAEQVLKDQWRRDYQREFEELFRREYQVEEIDLTNYLDKVPIPYVSFYAYGENIAVLRKSSDEISLGAAYQRFCDRLMYLEFPWEVFEVLPEPTKIQVELQSEASVFDYDAYFAYEATDEAPVKYMSGRLSQRGVRCFLQRKNVAPGEKWAVVTTEAIQKSRYILLFVGASGAVSWQDQKQLALIESLSKGGSNRIIPIFLPDTPQNATHRIPFLRDIQAITMKSEDDPVAAEFVLRVISPETAFAPVDQDALVLTESSGLKDSAPATSTPDSHARESLHQRRYVKFAIGLALASLITTVTLTFKSYFTKPHLVSPSTAVLMSPPSVTAPPSTSSDPAPTSGIPVNYLLGNVVAVTIHVASTRDHHDAEKAAKVLRDHGYLVKGITAESLDQAPHETTVRFFQFDKSTVSTGKALVKLLQAMGFVVRTEFDNEFVGQTTVPDAGTYEFYLGSTTQTGPVGMLLTSFSVDVPSGIVKAGREGAYNWMASASGSWVENFNGKYVNTYEFSGRTEVDGCNGGIFQKVGSKTERVFIPDAGCQKMILKYSKNQNWQDVAQMTTNVATNGAK